MTPDEHHCGRCKLHLTNEPGAQQRAVLIRITPLQVGRGIREEYELCLRCWVELDYGQVMRIRP